METINFKNPKTLNDIKNLSFVDSVHSEYDGMEKTYWVYFDTDYKSKAMECSMVHESTVKELISAISEGVYYDPVRLK